MGSECGIDGGLKIKIQDTSNINKGRDWINPSGYCFMLLKSYPCVISNLLLNTIGWGLLVFLGASGLLQDEANSCFSDIDMIRNETDPLHNSTMCFCEEIRTDRIVAQMSNTFSNLIFTAGGIFIAWCTDTQTIPLRNRVCWWENNVNLMTYHTYFPLSFSLVFSNISYSSAYFHGGFSNWGGALDVLAIIIMSFWFLLHSILNLYLMCTGWGRRKMKYATLIHVLLLVTTCTALCATWFSIPMQGSLLAEIFVFSIGGLAIFLEICGCCYYSYCKGRECVSQRRIAMLAIIAFTVGFICQKLGSKNEMCDPTSYFQLHAIWHLLVGVAVTILFFFLLSNKCIGD